MDKVFDNLDFTYAYVTPPPPKVAVVQPVQQPVTLRWYGSAVAFLEKLGRKAQHQPLIPALRGK